MTDTNEKDPTKIRFMVGPAAISLLLDVPQGERAVVLDKFINKANARSELQPDADGISSSRGNLHLYDLSEYLLDMLGSHEEMLDAIKVGFNQLLEELKNTRALIGTTLVEDDERQAIIERMHVVTETRQAAADAISQKLGLDMHRNRREMEEQIAPVVKDARDPEQDTEIQARNNGGRER